MSYKSSDQLNIQETGVYVHIPKTKIKRKLTMRNEVIEYLLSQIDLTWKRVLDDANGSLISTTIDFITTEANKWNGLCSKDDQLSNQSFVQMGIVVSHFIGGQETIMRSIGENLANSNLALTVDDVLCNCDDLNKEIGRIVDALCSQCKEFTVEVDDDLRDFADLYLKTYEYLKPIVLIIPSIENVKFQYLEALLILLSARAYQMPIFVIIGTSDYGINDQLECLTCGECSHGIAIRKIRPSNDQISIEYFLKELCFDNDRFLILPSAGALELVLSDYHALNLSYEAVLLKLRFIVIDHVQNLSLKILKHLASLVAKKTFEQTMSPIREKRRISQITSLLLRLVKPLHLDSPIELWTFISLHHWHPLFSDSLDNTLNYALTCSTEIDTVLNEICFATGDNNLLFKNEVEQIRLEIKNAQVTHSQSVNESSQDTTVSRSAFELQSRLDRVVLFIYWC
ncbi:hypothetical protein ACOME3_003925 [Neoechinorhynchus agilis]